MEISQIQTTLNYPIKKAAFQQPFPIIPTTLFHYFYNVTIVENQQINTAGEIGCRNEECSAFCQLIISQFQT